MAEGFKIADAYVDIVADLDRNQTRRRINETLREISPQVEHDAQTTLGRAFTNGISQSFRSNFNISSVFTDDVRKTVRQNSRDTIGRSILDGIRDGLTGAGGGIGSVFSSIFSKPVLIAAALPLVPVLAGALSAAITSALGLGLGAGIIGLSALLLSGDKSLVSVFKKSVAEIKKILTKAAQPMLKPLKDAVAGFVPIVKQLAPDLKQIFTFAPALVTMLMKGLGGFLPNLLVGIRDSMGGIHAAFAGFTKMMPALGSSIGNFFKVILSDAPLVEKVTADIMRGFVGLIDFLGPMILNLTYIWSGFTNLMKLEVAGLGIMWGNLWRNMDAGSGMIANLTAAWKPLGDQMKRVWDAFKDFARTEDDKLMKQKFLVLVEEIKKLWSPLKNFLAVVWKEAWDAIVRTWDAYVVPWWNNTVKPWLMSEIKGAIKGAFASAVAAGVAELYALPGKAAGALGTLGGVIANQILIQVRNFPTLLYSAGQSIIQGLINGINAQIGRLRTVLSGITNMIPQIKGPPAKDKKLLEPAGRLVMQGFQAGLQSEMAGLKSMLGQFTTSLPRAAVPAANQQAGPGRPPLTININGGVWADEESRQRLVAWLFEALNDHEKAYA